MDKWNSLLLLQALGWASQVVLVVENPLANAGDIRAVGSTLGSGRSPGGGPGNPPQYSRLENPMDRGAWWATVHRVTKSQTWLKQLSTPQARYLPGMQNLQRHQKYSIIKINNILRQCFLKSRLMQKNMIKIAKFKIRTELLTVLNGTILNAETKEKYTDLPLLEILIFLFIVGFLHCCCSVTKSCLNLYALVSHFSCPWNGNTDRNPC